MLDGFQLVYNLLKCHKLAKLEILKKKDNKTLLEQRTA